MRGMMDWGWRMARAVRLGHMDCQPCKPGVAACGAAALGPGHVPQFAAHLLPALLPAQTTQKEECELRRVRMASIRRRLGLRRGGDKALGVLAMLAGSGEGGGGGTAAAAHCGRHSKCVD